MDLFEYRYPESPGFKTTGASMEAAQMLVESGKAKNRSELVFNYLKAGHVCTAEDVADATGLNLNGARSALAELQASGLVEKLAERGMARSGIRIHKWRVI